MSAIADSTIKQYSCTLVDWMKFCNFKEICPFSATVSQILEYLTGKFESGSSYGSLNSARAAISYILDYNISNNQLISKFFKAIYRIKPSRPKYQITWDTSDVLDFISNWFPLEELSLEKLTKKLVMLIALITAHRVQTLASIKIQNICVYQTKIEIKIPDMIKTSEPGKFQPLLVLPFFKEKPELCVASTLKYYLQKTESLRHGENNLFLAIKKPHKHVTSQTISKWIKTVLYDSGIDVSVFSSHSTRHAATSKAYTKGIDINIIKNTAGWSKKSNVFAKFYNKPITQNNENFAMCLLK